MKKKLGQVFTDKWIVNLILDTVLYNNKEILNKNIIEPACGDGAFLSEIVNRYISIALNENWSMEAIKKGLETYIYGVELDYQYYIKCLQNLNKIVLTYNIKDVNWNILNADTLKLTQFNKKMDFVVGNPPYVRIHNLDDETRYYLKNNFKLCNNGIIDLYIAFYELGVNMLNHTGKLCFITPNSFMYNTTLGNFRSFIKKNKLLSELINFGSNKLFKASTYNAIVLLDKFHNSTKFKYYTYEQNKVNFIDNLDLIDFENKIWSFSSKNNLYIINKTLKNINENYNIQYGLATLRDKIYISDNVKIVNEQYSLFNGNIIENELLQPIIKGSTYNGEDITSKIIMPYRLDNNKWVVINEEELGDKYPYTYFHFLKNKEELLKRNLENDYETWYQLGRSQGLQNIHNDKLVFKHIVKLNDNVKTYLLPKEVFVYSGIFITGNNLNLMKEKLESTDFSNYVNVMGKDFNNGYKVINTKLIKNYIY